MFETFDISYYVESKIYELISSVKKYNDELNFRCPICGDSKKKKAVKRIKRNSLFLKDSIPRDIGIEASVHGAHCSCYMCGNPRKYYGDTTIQEKKALLSENDN
jgi:rubredoxin